MSKRPPIDREQAANFFAYAEATPEQTHQCVQLRTACGQVARIFVDACDDPTEQELGLRKLKEACQAMINGVVRPYPRSTEWRR